GSSTDQSSYIKAYICGYVANPGVYTLNQGDRLDDLLRLAGGFTKEADPRGVNLAYLVKDQDYFRILSINETKDSIDNKPGDLSVNSMAGNKINTSSSEDSKDVKININTASKEQLKELPRIGDSMSQRIIDYREKEGGFKTLDDIKEVSGIGEKMFENIKDKITVE
ncbi:MAG: ComEA family DNA-binding protein, partial [Clostridium sp.]